MNENVEVFKPGQARLSGHDRASQGPVHPLRNASRHFLDRIGQRIVLPASFTGGERYMYAQYQDAIAMVREFGKPDLFMTVTCNSHWSEIKDTARRYGSYITAQDRPDIVARVWQQKSKAVLKDLDDGVLGRQIARIYVVEFQKRELPHAHILILADEDKPKTREQFDDFVSAEVPDPAKNRDLDETVLRNMIHGPCGQLDPKCGCMVDGKCSKEFPKPLSEVTQTNQSGYPVYRRRRRPGGILKFEKEYDNAIINPWVVSYNPYFTQRYDCHINLEVCSTVTAVKYLYKYVYKGSGRTEISLQAVQNEAKSSENPKREPNEIIRHIRARYISPVEACQRLFEYPDQGETHSVVTLDVHAPKQQRLAFSGTADPAKTLAKGTHMKLTRFFELARRDEEARDLRTVNNHPYNTYKDAAMAAGLMQDDKEWKACMDKAKSFQMSYQLRQLFVTILVYCMPGDVGRLWKEFYVELSRDSEYNYRNHANKEEVMMFSTVQSLNELLNASSSDLAKFADLPQLSSFEDLHEAPLLENRLISHDLQRYDRDELQRILGGVDSLNVDQRAIYDEITAAVEGTRPGQKLFFVDGTGGTGKSTLLNHVLAQVRVGGGIAIAVTSRGIASLLLPGGRTAHSTFKIPIKLTQTSTCFIQKQTHLQAFIERAKLIVWDEAPMTHRHAFEAVDRTLRDILKNGCDSFGGKVVVLSGDFRQILPVVKNGTALDTVEASLRYSFLWSKFKQVHLTENMRVLRAANAKTEMELREFAELLLEVDEGRHEVDLGQDFMKVPQDLLIPNPEYDPSIDRYEDPNGVPISLGLKRVVDAMYNQTDLNNSMVANDEYVIECVKSASTDDVGGLQHEIDSSLVMVTAQSSARKV